jgi:tetratricopeptide (TPR) repeat protein
MRDKLLIGLILLILLLAVTGPFVSSGYSALRAAKNAPSHIEAAEQYITAAKRIPWRPDLYELAGHHYYYAKEYSLADSIYRKSFQRNALSADGWVAWGDVNYLNGDTERAAEIWEQGIEQSNVSDKLYSRLSQTYEENRDFSNAASLLQKYVETNPNDASSHYRLGLFLTLTDPSTASAELITASQLDPQFDPAVQTLRTALNLSTLSEVQSKQKVVIGRGLGLVEEWELAHAAFEQAVETDEKNAEAWAWLGEAEQQTGGEDALKYLDRALELDPNSSVVRGLRGLYFHRIGNHRDALNEFQSASKLEPENPTWHVSIGEEYSKLGNLISALEAYQYATTLAPEDANYWRLLAVFSAQNNVNVPDVGIPAAQRAVHLSQQDPLALDALGWLLVLNGRYYEAERILKQALEHDSQLAPAHFHLALLYMQTGDRTSMFDQLVQARDLGSEEAGLLLQQEFP